MALLWPVTFSSGERPRALWALLLQLKLVLFGDTSAIKVLMLVLQMGKPNMESLTFLGRRERKLLKPQYKLHFHYPCP